MAEQQAAIERERLSVLPEGCTTLHEAVVKYEGELIRKALELENGSVTRAARCLGVSYQTLASSLAGRQREIQKFRTPMRARRVSQRTASPACV